MAFGSLPSVLGSGGGTAYSLIGGTGLFADGTAAAPSISFAADTDTGFYRSASNRVSLSLGGSGVLNFAVNGVISNAISGASLTLSDSTGAISLVAAGTNQNVTLTPSGTGVVSVISGGNTNNGRLELGTGPFTGYISNEASSTGAFAINTTGSIALRVSGSDKATLLQNGRFLLGTTTDSGALLQIGTNTTTSAGGIVFGTDTFLYRDGAGTLVLNGTGTNSYVSFLENGVAKGIVGTAGGDFYLGTSTAKSVFLRTNGSTALTLDSSQVVTSANEIRAGSNFRAASSGLLYWNSSSVLFAPSDGVIRLTNNAQTDFSRLQFGGTTASFPALSRVSNTLRARLADESGYASFVALEYISSGAATGVGAGQISYGATTATTVGAAGGASALPATPTGYIIVNVAGTQMKVPYYAN